MPVTRFDGARFRQLREAKGLSREAVAGLVGKTHRSVVRYELGTSTPHLHTIGELAALVEVSPLELIITEFHSVAEQVNR